MLSKSPDQYKVGDILRLTEGNLAPVACLEKAQNDCPRKGTCSTLPIWQGLHKVICDYLDNITLQDIIDQNF
jgi:DNA-binding IscR family transcriptional regulator